MQLEIDRTDLHRTRLVDEGQPEPADGEVVLGLERYAVTANNVTYAVIGDMIGYWRFFPTEEPWIRVPVMGYADVVASAHDEVEVGTRVFGFFPMGRWLTITARPTDDGFVDTAEHRAPYAGAYRSYTHVDAAEDLDHADRSLLLRGLFLTSFLLDDALAEAGFHGAEQVVVLSASSKTAIALAHRLADRDVQAIGCTSAGNVDFVAGLGLYDEVVSYDELDRLRPAPSVVVDMAGSGAGLAEVHTRLGEGVRFSSQVGLTHWETFGQAADVPGPRPELFFAPSQIAVRTEDWGHDGFAARTGEALDAFVDHAAGWLHLDRSSGPDEAQRVFLDTLDGRVPPDRGQIVLPG